MERRMENEEHVPVPSPPTTPGTPGAPLFRGFRGDERSVAPKKSLLSRTTNCFRVETTSIEDGGLPAVLAEFVGTLILIFSGTATAIVNEKTQGSESLIGCAASSGLAVMIVILSTGHISGAHLNPALTIAFAALKHFPWSHVPMYILAQVLASFCAAFILKGIFHPIMSGGVTVPVGHNYAQTFALEFVITFILMFVVTAVATDTRAVGELAGIAVGATVMLNILIAGPSTGASMNPIRTLGPAVAAQNYKAIWIYLTAPILGALCGAGVYSAIKLQDDEETSLKQPSAHGSFRM
ncbi:hypothetical protein V2J09_005375 [Rumex salicifolius]